MFANKLYYYAYFGLLLHFSSSDFEMFCVYTFKSDLTLNFSLSLDDKKENTKADKKGHCLHSSYRNNFQIKHLSVGQCGKFI